MVNAVQQREADFRRDVLATLRTLGYLATAIRRSDGVTLGDTGLPDVIAVHPQTGAFLALELKADPRRHATPAQLQWLEALNVPRVDALTTHRRAADVATVVRPEDWPAIAAVAAEFAGHKVRSTRITARR